MNSIKDKKLIYHLTKLDNLDKIIDKGLLSREELDKQKIRFDDVADAEILDFRKNHELQKYVPFHFFTKNPFDGKVQKNHKDENFVYLALERDLAKKHNFKIIPRHPLNIFPFEIFDYIDGMNAIEWDIMDKRDYKDYNCKEICMAECLCDKSIDIKCFYAIYVRNEETKIKVRDMLLDRDIYNIQIYVNENMFC